MALLNEKGLSHLWSKLKAKLNGKSDVGHTHNYNELNGKPTILGAAVGGYNGAITVGGDGVAEMGKYIDFHDAPNTGNDFSTRFMCTGEHGNMVYLPSASGYLVVGDRALKIVFSGSAPSVNDTSVMTVQL